MIEFNTDGKTFLNIDINLVFELMREIRGFRVYRYYNDESGVYLWMVRFKDGSYKLAPTFYRVEKIIEEMVMQEAAQ